jgi:hypothetical protein
MASTTYVRGFIVVATTEYAEMLTPDESKT